MNEREYLVTKGLAKMGRGRLSKQAHEALELAKRQGVVFDSRPVAVSKPRKPSPEPQPEQGEGDPLDAAFWAAEAAYVPPPVEPWTKVRDTKQITGYYSDGLQTKWFTCQECARHIIYCDCVGGPLAPTDIVKVDGKVKVRFRKSSGAIARGE